MTAGVVPKFVPVMVMSDPAAALAGVIAEMAGGAYDSVAFAD